MNIYTIIVTYNGKHWMDYCLRSLTTSTVPTTPIIVDNGSTDGTIDYIQHNYPNAILIQQTQNLGFGQANNIGIKYALEHGATHILLLNQDAAILQDTLEILLNYDDGQHLLTPIHLNGNGSDVDDNFYRNTILDSISNDITKDVILRKELEETYPITYVNAACWLLPTDIIRRVGGFNPLFFQYGEDNNYIHRLHYHHFGIRLVTKTIVFHDREKHGHENIYQKGYIYRKLLLNQTNINLAFAKRFNMRHKICLQEIGHAILHHYFIACISETIGALCKIVQQSSLIRNSRKEEVQDNGAWLNYEL